MVRTDVVADHFDPSLLARAGKVPVGIFDRSGDARDGFAADATFEARDVGRVLAWRAKP